MNKMEVEQYIDNLSDSELLTEWNNYCDNDRRFDDMVYKMNMLDDVIGYGLTPSQVLDKIDLTEFNTNDNYFIWTIYGIKSSDNIRDLIFIDDLKSYLERD